MSLNTQIEIENKLKQLETRLINLEVYKNHLETDKLWKLRQQIESNTTVLENIRSALNPILEKEIWDSYYIKDMVNTIEELPAQLENVKLSHMNDVANLYVRIDELKHSFNKINTSAEEVSKALEELYKRIAEFAPAQDAQKNRAPEQKDDLEIFEPNDWIFDGPVKIHYENNGEEVWY